jgi:hypothetical protein
MELKSARILKGSSLFTGQFGAVEDDGGTERWMAGRNSRTLEPPGRIDSPVTTARKDSW